jgi:ATP:ADP antiporter, AAA family
MSTEGSCDGGTRTSRWLGRTLGVRPDEIATVLLAAGLFFFILAGYFAVRSLRETIGTELGAERVANLYVAVWLLSILVVPILGYVVSRHSRAAFLPWVYGLVAAVFFAVGLTWHEPMPAPSVAVFFSVFISVLNLFLTSLFWSFLLELFSQEQAKRVFGVIAAGGTAGALCGPIAVDVLVLPLGHRGILFFAAISFVLAIACQRLLLSRALQRGGGVLHLQTPIGGNPFAGFAMVMRSPYLIGISGYVFLLAVLNTILYLKQLHLVQQSYADTIARTQFFARLDWIVQGATILLQLAATGRVVRRLGVPAVIIMVPTVMIVGFVFLGAIDTLLVLSIVIITRRVSENAFVRPTREILFAPLANEVRYKAKSTIDVPVYRGADALTAQLSTKVFAGITPTASAAWGAVAALLCAVVARFIGSLYQRADPSPNSAAK